MELSLLILVCIHKSYIIYLEIYVVPIMLKRGGTLVEHASIHCIPHDLLQQLTVLYVFGRYLSQLADVNVQSPSRSSMFPLYILLYWTSCTTYACQWDHLCLILQCFDIVIVANSKTIQPLVSRQHRCNNVFTFFLFRARFYVFNVFFANVFCFYHQRTDLGGIMTITSIFTIGPFAPCTPLQNPKYASDVNMPSQTKWGNVGWKISTFLFNVYKRFFFNFCHVFLTIFNVFHFLLERFFTSMVSRGSLVFHC